MTDFDLCLCIMFNHPYPGNIETLERLYRGRFPRLKFLIPFYRSDNPDVITVYRGSYTHQGYVTDAWPRLANEGASHFIFLQDDVLLNPAYNAENLAEVLCLDENAAFIPQLRPLSFEMSEWHWLPGILWRMFYPRNLLSGSGCDSFETVARYLPPVGEAQAKMDRLSIKAPKVTRGAGPLGPPVRDIPHFGTLDPHLVQAMNNLVVDSLFATAERPDQLQLPYPLALTVWAADFYVIPRDAMDLFQHYCGVLAAALMFAEVAVGTAMVLAVDHVVTAIDASLEFDWVWSEDRDHQAERLLAQFENPRMAAVHPVKISQLGSQPDLLDAIVAGGRR
jgi:hypothetical protein